MFEIHLCVGRDKWVPLYNSRFKRPCQYRTYNDAKKVVDSYYTTLSPSSIKIVEIFV